MTDTEDFSKRFPKIKKISISVSTKSTVTNFEKENPASYDLDHPPPRTVSCPKSGCSGYEFQIWNLIQKKIALDELKFDENLLCKGDERMGKHDYRHCLGNCHVVAEIELIEPNQSVDTTPASAPS